MPKTKVTPIAAGDLLTRKQAAEILGYAENTLAKIASTGEKDIPYIRLGGPSGPVRYRREDLAAFIEASPKCGCQAA